MIDIFGEGRGKNFIACFRLGPIEIDFEAPHEHFFNAPHKKAGVLEWCIWRVHIFVMW